VTELGAGEVVNYTGDVAASVVRETREVGAGVAGMKNMRGHQTRSLRQR
jgi:hypothetical protein